MILYLLACIALAIVFGGGYYAYREAFYYPPQMRKTPHTPTGPLYAPYTEEMKRLYHQLDQLPCETVTIRSQDGLLLSGRYYHVSDGAPLDIGFHGYHSCPATDFSGGSELSFELGHNLLLVDQRAHGNSEGRTITFGIKERQDCLDWIQYAVSRFGEDVRILLYGVSMGGSTVLMASELELPANVKGIIADCPYGSPMDIILHIARRRHIPMHLARFFVTVGAKVYGGFDIAEADAAAAVKNSHVPILILHGESDGFVPCSMSDVAAGNPAMVTRYLFPNADHGISYLVDTPRYRQVVRDFVETALKN